MAKLYADENFAFPVVLEMRNLGHDVLTAQEAGQAGKGIVDEDVLAFAISQTRAVLTFNRKHFIRLHGRIFPHDGILVCTKDDDVLALANRIHQALGQCPNLQNQLLRINKPSTP